MIEGKKCSSVVLKARKIGKWVDVSTDDIFKGKKVILFSLPGAFTPVCSEKQLPGFEENYDKLLNLGINEVYCISVNDGVVEKWWQEDGMNNDGNDPDPYEQTTPENCIKYLSKK